jgi:ankyrin repeat protein
MNNSTPLQFAVIGNSKEIVSLLIARGAFIPAEKPGYLSLFHDWALGAGDPGIADILQTHGADVNARLSDGQTPLHLAAHQGEKRAVEWLLSHGAEINAKDKRGDTPLALLKPRRGPGQRTEIADLLRSHGAQ